MTRCDECGAYNTGVYEKDGWWYFNRCNHPIPGKQAPTLKFYAIEAGMHPDYPVNVS